MSFLGSLVDAATGFGGSFLGQYFNKKNMRDQAGLQYDYAARYAKNSPTWNIEGLRYAGLNPMLAVSNGVNFGANIPSLSNHSPDVKVNTKFMEGLRAENEIAIGRQNADANTTNAESQGVSAAADMLRAKSDAALKSAQTAETLQRTGFERDRLGQKRYNSPIVRDVMGMVDDLTDASKEVFDDVSSYLTTEPTRPDGTSIFNRPVGKSSQTRHSDAREKETDRVLNSMWKTRKKIDGKPVYRKRGDVGGVMHMYR